MDKNKLFFLITGGAILLTVLAAFTRFVIIRDFIIKAEADCDPLNEACFVYHCDPELEECSEDPADDTYYFKVLRRNARYLPDCDPADENCPALICPAGEKDCSFVYCNEERAAFYEVECGDPETYLEEQAAAEAKAAIEAAEEAASGEGDPTETADELLLGPAPEEASMTEPAPEESVMPTEDLSTEEAIDESMPVEAESGTSDITEPVEE
jgi:hypothetical protein